MTIDWNAQLETDEPTPRPAVVIAPRYDGVTGREVRIDNTVYKFATDGRSAGTKVRIRNVRRPALRTSDEALQRMENLVRRMASMAGGHFMPDSYTEAAAIVKLLPKPPVDPDLIEARKIAETVWRAQSERLSPLNEKRAVALGDGTSDDSPMMHATLAAIKRGRELGPAGYKWVSTGSDGHMVYERVSD